MTIDLGDKSKVVTYKTNGVTNCLDLCKMILNNYGLNNYGNSNNIYRLMHEVDGALEYYGKEAEAHDKGEVDIEETA